MSNEAQTDATPIPGPAGHFLFGSAREYYAGRVRFFTGLAQQYGDVVRYRLGCDWHYLIDDPSMARAMLRDWERIDNTRPDREFQLDESFIAQPGRDRVEPRRLVHSTMCPRTVATSHDRMVRVAEAMLDEWEPGARRDAVSEMMRLNIEMVSSTLFGRPAASWLAPVLPMLTDLQLLVGTYTESEQTVQRLSATRRPEVFAAIEEAIDQLVGGLEEPLPRRAPALEIMLAERAAGRMTRRRMVHEIGVMLMTTAPAGAAKIWALICLAHQPRARALLEAELDTLGPGPLRAEDLDRLSYLPCFIKEVLRLYPPQGLISRGTYTEWEEGTLRIPAECGIDISPYLLHRHPRYWNEPERFEPARFDEDSPLHHPEQKLAYMPFGLGIRRCIGEGLATRQLQVLVASVVRRFRLELCPDWVLQYDFSPLGVLHPEPLEVPLRARARS